MKPSILKDLGNRISAAGDEIAGFLPGFDFSKPAEIPVYIVHNSPDPEDYFFLLDFEAFMSESQKGLFTRPVLKIWAGRSDFERYVFARKLREAFSNEFTRMQLELRTKHESKGKWGAGWFSFGLMDVVGAATSGLLHTVILFLAVSTGKSALKEISSMLGLRSGKDKESKVLEDQIEAKKQVIDAALMEIKISLHRELYAHAYRGQAPGKLTGMDYQAWPLPAFVREHLGDKTSLGWW